MADDGEGGGSGAPTPVGGGNVQVFLRLKPSKRPSGLFAIERAHNQLDFTFPPATEEFAHNGRPNQKFKFDGIFDVDARQDDVFEAVARQAVDNVMEGYNATVFAYGQTGSGKTFTITGGAERYEDRGLIPRALSRMFQAMKDRVDEQFTVYISYLEIYNEAGYDLLDPSHESKTLEELPRVAMMEDEEGNVHLKNLAMHPASSEEEALNLLFLGDTNRAIAETPMNLASSRSHCIFTISMESRKEGSSAVRRSKLHLVDLAGSERVHKTNASGQLFREATHINKSLHFLEMVIVALQEQRKGTRSHIPYRNSMLTNVLRDSLGGNCKTSMIATINIESEHTGESVSTCRFAQRVALVRNSAIVNEAVDPNILIRQLRGRLQGMEAEMKVLKSGLGEGEALTPKEAEELNALVRAYLHGPDGGDLMLGELTMTRIKAAFAACRGVVREWRDKAMASSTTPGTGDRAASAVASTVGDHAPTGTADAVPRADADKAAAVWKDEIKRLKAQVMQRDNEIAILVGMVKAHKAQSTVATTPSAPPPPAMAPAPPSHGVATVPMLPPGADALWLPGWGGGGVLAAPSPTTSTTTSARSIRQEPLPPTPSPSPLPPESLAPGLLSVGIMLADGVTVGEEVLRDRGKALEVFKRNYPANVAIEDNKRVLRDKYDLAKATAERVNAARDATNRLKAEIERARVEKAMAHIVGGKDGGEDGVGAGGEAEGSGGVEAELTAAMAEQKAEYRAAFQLLRDLKAEIENVQRTLEQNRLKMQNDFESWLANCWDRLGAGSSAASTAAGTGGASASGSSMGPGGVTPRTAVSAGRGGMAPPPSTTAALEGATGGRPSLAPSSSPIVAPWPAGAPVPMASHAPWMMGTAAMPMAMPMMGHLMPGQVAPPINPYPPFPTMVAPPYVAPWPPASVPSSYGSTTPASGAAGWIPAATMPPTPLIPHTAPGFKAAAEASPMTTSSGPPPALPGAPSGGGVMLTGNAGADADIVAFYRAKDELLKRTRSGGAGLAAIMADAARLSATTGMAAGAGGGGAGGVPTSRPA